MTCKQSVQVVLGGLLAFTSATSAQAASGWTPAQVVQLRQMAQKAPEDALPVPDTGALDKAVVGGVPGEIDKAATDLALCLARMNLLGEVSPAGRINWHIADSDAGIDLSARLDVALAGAGLAAFFAGLAPDHPEYGALRRAYAMATDRTRRENIARNMERWRWLPQSLGRDYILVNAASFEARLWRDGVQAGTWKVIVGKPSTPTPVFSASVHGVIVNPWWTVPASIIREKRGRFPSSQGYVRSGNRVQQRPGPSNALGVVKLDMPNPFSVYLHDTPSKALFARPVRAFSHGCVRVDDALGLASTLIGPARTRAQLDAIVTSRQTVEIPLAAPLAIFITYFTAGTDHDGKVVLYPDIYGRDAGSRWISAGKACDA